MSSLFFTKLRFEVNVIKKQIFDSLDEIKEAFGEDGIIAITEIKQVIFYISRYNIQPVWISPSEKRTGRMAYYFIKAETKKPYTDWMTNRPKKNTL